MPVKIGFQVVATTGEDERFRAAELNHHGPMARGWRSPVNCKFPQEIILQLNVLAILQQIQILVHQYLIPQKIEISLRINSNDLFEYLGYITFSDNLATGFRSRELKSILIPSKKAKYIKLRIHSNHVNVKNLYNQVSLIAVNILGNELHTKTEETEMNNNYSFHPSSSFINNSNYLSPYDDLAFQMSVDEETARIIKIIEYKMLQLLLEERLDEANALKITLENLRAAGEILAIYEQEKRKAIFLEDFDRAKAKKLQIDQFRARIYTTLRIDQLLEEADSADDYDVNSNPEEKLTSQKTPRRDQNDNESPSKGLRPLPLTHSQSQTFPDATPPSGFSTSISNPQLYQYLKQTRSVIPERQENDGARTPTSESDFLTGDASTPEKESKPKNLSLIPRLDHRREPQKVSKSPTMKTSASETKIRAKASGANLTKSSFEAYEERMLPALRNYHGNEVVRECQLGFDQQRKSKLNEREKKQAMLPIAVFGMELIEKFYSKSFNEREEGLKQLQQELKKLAGDESNGGGKLSWNKIGRAAIFLLHRALRDTVFSVYKLAAETVRLFFSEFVPKRISPSEVARSVEKLLPELLTKSGDVTPRIHNLAAHTLLSMAECEEVRRLNIIPAHLSRPLTSSVHPRLALSRLEMVEQLILNHGISKDKKSGLTCRTLAEFGSSGLHHPAEAVRKVSERILIHVYKENPRIVRKQLPPDDNVTRRNLLYRQLFQEFDFMDVQRKLNEQTLEESTNDLHQNPTTKRNPEPKKRGNDPSPVKKGEQRSKTFANGDLKFPSLTDSIHTTKTRLEQGKAKNPGGKSGIPVPIFGRGKPAPMKPATTRKSIKIKMFDPIEDEAYRSLESDGVKEETEMSESVKFSESMLASIRENEFTMSTLFNEDNKLKTCIFCLSKRKWTTEDGLNMHYLKDCLMLTTCEYCTEVTEISGFTNHLLDDCKWKNLFQKCENCREAILSDLYEKHECTAVKGKVPKTRCPFCHKTIGNEESSWRRHLMGSNTCPNHPRQK